MLTPTTMHAPEGAEWHCACASGKAVDRLLAEGWEPFAGAGRLVWLRRRNPALVAAERILVEAAR